MLRTEQDRILVALDACSDLNAAALDTVLALAARLGANVEGLFVEDTDLLRAAGLPFVTEILAAGSERVLTPEHLRQVNRDVSAEQERRIVETAREYKVQYRHSVAQGARLTTAIDAAKHCDLFMPRRSTPQGPAARSKRAGNDFRRIGVMADEPARIARAVTILQALARTHSTREVVVACANEPQAGVLSQIARARVGTFLQSLTMTSVDQALRELGARNIDLLIASKELLLEARDTPSLSYVLDTQKMSMLLLR